MIGLIQSLWLLLILAFTIFRFKIGLAIYLAYIFLVPYMRINLGAFVLQWNLVNLVVLLMAIYEFKFKRKKIAIDFKPLLPFIIYFGVSLFMMLFQSAIPFGVQFDAWRMNLMKFMILPFALWNEMRVDNSSIKLYRNVTIVCIVIAACYGLFLTTMPGINPYIMLLSEVNGTEFNEAYALAQGGGRLFGRISSVFSHPMMYGLFLGLSLVYVFYNRRNINKYLFFGLFFIIAVDILICGVRSVIGGIAIAIILFFLQNRNFKLMLIASFLCIIGYYVITSIPDMTEYLGSITDINNKNVAGSSVEMRLNQFEGCLKEIDDCFLYGKGYGWTGYYKSVFGDHPTMLAFESLIYVVLCNSGLIGVILWIYMAMKIIFFNCKFKKDASALLNALLFFYLAYSCITGEYGYMQYYILFYIIMLGELLLPVDKPMITK